MLDKKLNEYFEKFGKNYPLCPWSDKTEDEIIDDIESCLESGIPADDIDFDDDCDY